MNELPSTDHYNSSVHREQACICTNIYISVHRCTIEERSTTATMSTFDRRVARVACQGLVTSIVPSVPVQSSHVLFL